MKRILTLTTTYTPIIYIFYRCHYCRPILHTGVKGDDEHDDRLKNDQPDDPQDHPHDDQVSYNSHGGEANDNSQTHHPMKDNDLQQHYQLVEDDMQSIQNCPKCGDHVSTINLATLLPYSLLFTLNFLETIFEEEEDKNIDGIVSRTHHVSFISFH